MQTLDFIDSDVLFASIQEDLSSYDANNQLDPGRWHTWVKKIIADLGIACLEYKHALVHVKNYKGSIPDDFYIMDSAFLVEKDNCGEGLKSIINYQGRKIIWDDTATSCAYPTPGCGNSCEYLTCELTKFNEVVVREYVQGIPYLYTLRTRMYPLYVNQRNSKSWCLENSICFGSKDNHEISINNGAVFTNFEEGLILFNYYAYPLSENGLPKIPDNVKIKKALEDYIKWKLFEKLWINNDDMGSRDKMLYFKNEFENNSYPDAEYWVKLASMSDMMDTIRNYRSRFNIYQLIQK